MSNNQIFENQLTAAMEDIKNQIISMRGENFYYELIGERVRLITLMHGDYEQKKAEAIEFLGVDDIDHVMSFRISVLAHVAKSFENETVKKQVCEMALYHLALDTFEAL